MKKTMFLAHCLGLFCFSHLLYAADSLLSVNSVDYVRHVIINNHDRNIDYEINYPSGAVVTGQLGPKKSKVLNTSDAPLYGRYLIQYTICGEGYWWPLSCNSYNESLVVKKSEEVMWNFTEQGIVVTEIES